jgi:hypothetical protein
MMTWKMTLRRRSFPLAVVASCCLPNIIVSTHVYSDSFPTNDEYDFNILDPHHVYGSPYGGFGRATRSRLAALPLVLPGTVGEYSAENNEEEPFYMEMRNGDGRLFACRVYHEDELTASSLGESMFTTAELKYTASVDDDNEEGEEPVENTKEEPVVHEEESPQTITSTTGATSDEETLSNAMEMMQVLSKLDGVCTQIHKGWWSYEWCHGNKVTQFHVHVESGKPQQIQLESVTNLGAYSTSTVYDDGDPDEKDKPVMNKLVADKIKEIEGASEDDDPKELAVVVQDFIHGDLCDETQAPRTTKVKLKCCPLKRMNRLKRAVLFDGQPVASNIAAITKMQETSVCNYYIEVCTPLLCEGLADKFQDGLVAKEVAKGTDPKLVPTPLSREKKGTESIREIIDGSLRNVCLRFFNGGWYVFQNLFCETACHHSVFLTLIIVLAIGGSMSCVIGVTYVSFTRRTRLTPRLGHIPKSLKIYTCLEPTPRTSSTDFLKRTNQNT